MKTLLIADDSRFMRNLLRDKILKFKTVTIIEATNGQDAIDKYKLIKPNMAILDINMPVIDGLTALKTIISFDSNAKVIMCSAMGTKDNIQEALKQHATDFVVKPYFNGLQDILMKL